MTRTTIMLPRTLKAKAEDAARRKGVSLGELIRQALAATLRGSLRGKETDPLFADTAVYRGPVPSDTSAKHDKYLYEDAS